MELCCVERPEIRPSAHHICGVEVRDENAVVLHHHPRPSSFLSTSHKNEFLHADHVQILPLQPVGVPHLSDEHRVRLRLPHCGDEVSMGPNLCSDPFIFCTSTACSSKKALNTPSMSLCCGRGSVALRVVTRLTCNFRCSAACGCRASGADVLPKTHQCLRRCGRHLSTATAICFESSRWGGLCSPWRRGSRRPKPRSSERRTSAA